MARARRTGHSLVVLFLAIAALTLLLTLAVQRAVRKPDGILAKISYSSTVIDLRGGGYRAEPALAQGPDGEVFSSLVSRLKPDAAITGTFYGPDRAPLGDIVINGRLVHRGFQRQGIGFTRDGRIVFLERRGSSRINWRGCFAGLACGPRLLRHGKMDIDVRRDGFSHAAAKLEATRCAVGATKDGKLVLLAVTEPVTLATLAKAMLELEAVDAINMDGGALCALYADGRCQAEPVRPVSNVLAVYRTK